jgi:hypothetical protein
MFHPGDGFLQILIILAINFFVLQGFDKPRRLILICIPCCASSWV